MISHHQNSFVILAFFLSTSFVILACLLLAFEQLCASINLMEDVILYFQRAITSITEDLILAQDRVGYSLLNLLVVTAAMVECSPEQTNKRINDHPVNKTYYRFKLVFV
ncbi:hypothetical protein Peur_033855 [Populus x canadensis]